MLTAVNKIALTLPGSGKYPKVLLYFSKSNAATPVT
jgi:hypothetical protein